MLPIDRDFLVQAILDATWSVFSTMLESEPTPGPAALSSDEMEGTLVSLVGLTGHWSGTGSICCTPGVAGRLYARMLSFEPQPEPNALTDEVMDAAAELTNMIMGSIKNILEERVGPMAMNIPMVVYGRNFQVKRAGGSTGISVPFTWGSDRIDVCLFLAPAAEKNRAFRGRDESLVLRRA